MKMSQDLVAVILKQRSMSLPRQPLRLAKKPNKRKNGFQNPSIICKELVKV